MDFVKKILHQISRKSEAVSQITFDEDYNVPDADRKSTRLNSSHTRPSRMPSSA